MRLQYFGNLIASTVTLIIMRVAEMLFLCYGLYHLICILYIILRNYMMLHRCYYTLIQYVTQFDRHINTTCKVIYNCLMVSHIVMQYYFIIHYLVFSTVLSSLSLYYHICVVI